MISCFVSSQEFIMSCRNPCSLFVGFGLCNLSHGFLCFLNAAHVQSQRLIWYVEEWHIKCLALYVSMEVAVTYIQYSLVELQGRIAQWLEHLVYVQKVLGSIPSLVTFLYFNTLCPRHEGMMHTLTYPWHPQQPHTPTSVPGWVSYEIF